MYFEQFIQERGLTKSTTDGYKTTIKKYTQYYNMSLEDLINEAITEEDDSTIKKRQRSIRTRLVQFRSHLLNDTNLETSTIKVHMRRLSAIYKYFEVDVPKLPSIKDNAFELTYMDLPNVKHIEEAYQMAGLRLGSLILFMSSTGTGRTECSNLKVKDFIQACNGYYKSTELIDILNELHNSLEPIVPTFNMFRIKTQKNYYTFCTPETTNSIIDWLLLKNELLETNDEKLLLQDSIWDWNPRNISNQFQELNDELGWGFKNKYRFFRPHALRKFHASNIGLSEENVDFLQGRSKDKLHATYIKANPEKLKQLYMDVMENVTIGKLDKKEIIHEDFTININLNFYGNEYSNIIM